MGFDLFFRFEGLNAFLSSATHAQTDVVVIRPTCAEHHGHHTALLSILVGKVSSPCHRYELDSHDIRILDGTTEIFGAKSGGIHSFQGLPPLGRLLDLAKLRRGLRICDGPIDEVCAARLRLADGVIRTTRWSHDSWQLESTLTSAPIEASIGRVALEVEYQRQIMCSSLTVRMSKGTETPKDIVIEPDDTSVVLLLSNHPKKERGREPDVRNISPHFQAVYDLQQPVIQVDKHVLIQSTSEPRGGRAEFRGLHLPCVGGCTC